MTDPLGQSQVIPYLIGLSKEHQITIISFEKKNNFNSKQQTIQTILSTNKIVWKPLLYHKNPPILSTLFDIFILRKKSVSLYKIEKFDIVHCRSYVASLVGLFLNKKYGIKFIFDMRGFWADERVEGNIWNKNKFHYRLIYNFFKRMEIKFLESADCVIALTNAAKEYLERPTPAPSQKEGKLIFKLKNPIIVIPCCADLELFKPQIDSRKSIRKELEVENKFVLVYLGSIGTWYMLEEMLDFFIENKKENKNLVFLFITNEIDFVKKTIKEKNISENDIVIRNAARTEVPKYLSAADSAIFFIKPVFSKMASSPVKHGEILGCHLPLICNDKIGDVSEIVEQSETGVIIEKFDEQNYLDGFEKLKLLIQKGNINFALPANKYYSLKSGIEKYSEIYNNLK